VTNEDDVTLHYRTHARAPASQQAPSPPRQLHPIRQGCSEPARVPAPHALCLVQSPGRPASVFCSSGNHGFPPIALPREAPITVACLAATWTTSLTNACRGSLVPGRPSVGEWPTSPHPSWAEEPPKDQGPSVGVLRAHGVTPAHRFLHAWAKTSGASSHLSEPPEGVGPALASRMTSGE
jgi:hypothetical protein